MMGLLGASAARDVSHIPSCPALIIEQCAPAAFTVGIVIQHVAHSGLVKIFDWIVVR
jgi:hypothetical protein